MTVRVSKPAFNIREKVSELDKPTGLKGTELMRSETTQEARDLVSVGRKNLVINGDMRFNQKNGTHTTLTDYTLDRWKFQQDALDNYAHNVTQDADSPDAFNNSLKVEVTTSESALDTVEDLAVAQFIEAQNCQALRAGTSSAKPFTLSFWVKSTKVGTFSVSILADPDGNNKIFATTYKINVASTWEYKTIKIPPCSVTTIPDTNGKGLTLRWVLIAGSAYTTASGGVLHEWDDYHSSLWAGGHITQMMTDNDVWQLTGVQLEVGENATDFEYRSYGEELALCQRYFWREYGGVYHYEPGPTNGAGVLGQGQHPVAMRSKPTMSHNCSGSSNGASLSGNNTVGVWTWYKQNSGFDSGHSSYQTVANWNFANSEKGIHWNGGSYSFRPSDESGTTGRNLGVNTYIQATAEL